MVDATCMSTPASLYECEIHSKQGRESLNAMLMELVLIEKVPQIVEDSYRRIFAVAIASDDPTALIMSGKGYWRPVMATAGMGTKPEQYPTFSADREPWMLENQFSGGSVVGVLSKNQECGALLRVPVH